MWMRRTRGLLFFFFNDTATTEIYTLSLHDALPILLDDPDAPGGLFTHWLVWNIPPNAQTVMEDRKSTRLNSSHQIISYAVFCLKKKKTRQTPALPVHSHRQAQFQLSYDVHRPSTPP